MADRRDPPPPRPEAQPPARSGGLLRTVLLSALAAGAIIAAVIGWAIHRGGSLGGAMAYLGGDTVYVSPGQLALSGQAADVQQVTICNLTDEPVRVLGYNATCSCMRVPSLPLELAPHERKEVPVFAVSNTPRDTSVVFLTDKPNRQPIRVAVKVAGQKG